MRCVLEHLIKTRPASAVVVTDGYIEHLDRQLVKQVSATKLHVLITRDGSASELRRSGLQYTQLDKVPS
jgi:L-ascorbate metabolism protein UlaG (beta-lactamase superfamily)